LARWYSEAGLKYLLLGAVASAVLLYGIAMVFGLTGKTHLSEIVQAVSAGGMSGNTALLVGIVFLIGGFGFKIATVPFQMWVPDVYEGAPTPITAYLSVASKAAGFAVILRVFFEKSPDSVFVHGPVDVIGEEGKKDFESTRKTTNMFNKARRRGFSYENLLESCLIFTSTILVKRDLFSSIGIFDQSLRTRALELYDLNIDVGH
jgi:hypothetical protein